MASGSFLATMGVKELALAPLLLPDVESNHPPTVRRKAR